MTRNILILIFVLWSAAASAGGFMLLHVGSADGNSSGPPPTCNGTIDLSTGCTQSMLGGL